MQKESLTVIRQAALEDLAHWCDVYQNGSNDISWPDGTNLNLIRNHILYANGQIEKLSENGVQVSLFSAPQESETIPVPPRVSDNYLAKRRKFTLPDSMKPLLRDAFEKQADSETFQRIVATLQAAENFSANFRNVH